MVYDTDSSDEEGFDDLLEDNTKVLDLPVDGHSVEVGDWYEEEALPLGVVFGVQKMDDDHLKRILKDLNLNFGANGKRLKRGSLHEGEFWILVLGIIYLMMNVKLLSCNMRGSSSP